MENQKPIHPFNDPEKIIQWDASAICYTLFRGKIDHPFAGKEMQQML
jgi:hypothetical protein